MDKTADAEGFEWDDGNLSKNWEKHRVTTAECEEVFFSIPLIVRDDEKHSAAEKRFYAFGCTVSGRRLFVSFTMRGGKIRVISARDMDMRERMGYEKAKKDSGL